MKRIQTWPSSIPMLRLSPRCRAALVAPAALLLLRISGQNSSDSLRLILLDIQGKTLLHSSGHQAPPQAAPAGRDAPCGWRAGGPRAPWDISRVGIILKSCVGQGSGTGGTGNPSRNQAREPHPRTLSPPSQESLSCPRDRQQTWRYGARPAGAPAGGQATHVVLSV